MEIGKGKQIEWREKIEIEKLWKELKTDEKKGEQKTQQTSAIEHKFVGKIGTKFV